MSKLDPKTAAVDYSKMQITVKQSHFNLPAFSFLVCFGMLLLQWKADLVASPLSTIGVAALVSLVGWVVIALLLKFAVVLPLRFTQGLDRVASVCYAATFGLLLYYWVSPGDGVFDVLFTMAISAVLAIPCSLVLILPARVLVSFLGDLFTRDAEAVRVEPKVEERRLGCVRLQDSGVNHEMQLWIHQQGDKFHYEVKQWYKTHARYVRACTLESGKPQATYKQAFEQGQAAMERLLKS
ncbi:MAG: hypothetical protein K2X27_09005 [Candidatus Obscuribacterales bacterium]|nr:hypothetical protein [Candidatus Obscuribacterales bacterium]